MFDNLFTAPLYDYEIYEIAYRAETMGEAFRLADAHTKKLGQSNMIIGLALSQASIRLSIQK